MSAYTAKAWVDAEELMRADPTVENLAALRKWQERHEIYLQRWRHAQADSLADLDAATDDLASAHGDPVAERRALRTAFACLYEIREYVLLAEGKPYFTRAQTDGGGQIAEAIVYVRGFHTHDIVGFAPPKSAPLILPFRVGPLQVIGDVLRWPPVEFFEPRILADKTRQQYHDIARDLYEKYLDRYSVIAAFRAARVHFS